MSITRLAVATLVALAIATPASAQFGGLKKRMKGKVVQEGASKAAGETPAAPGANGGTIVLTNEVVGQLVTGLKAGQAEREAAAKEATPYGNYQKAAAAYAEAKPKCEAAQASFAQRMAEKPKALEKMNGYNEKMLQAQSKQDYKLMGIYQDSSMAMIDASCVVKQPERPEGYSDAQREVDVRAEQKEVKASGLSGSELAMVKERATAILASDTPPGDISASEKSAVSAKSAELKPLLGIQEQPAARATKPAPEPTPEPAAATVPAQPTVDPQMAANAQAMGNCMAKNIQSHQAQIEALSKRAQAAQAANDNQKLLAIADTVQRIQMAGCLAR
jgi:hypothetical protein